MSKLYLALFSLTLLFLFSSCKDEVNPLLTNSTGKLKMSIDKANAPTNVFFVKATLTKENCNEVDATLNLKSDTTADITIDNLDAGQWHLKVEAFDSLMGLKYSGETDVTITENYLTQVNLTLNPVSSGLGSIYINVTWGTISDTWIDYSLNPILTPSNVPGFPIHIGQHSIIYDGGKYQIWFNNIYSGGTGAIYYGESYDGISWTFPKKDPVILPGSGWDNKYAIIGNVIKDGDTYKLYYAGKSFNSDLNSIGLATSKDGINWTKLEKPILTLDYLNISIDPHSVIKYNNKYYLYYGLNGLSSYVGVAVSDDGINFTSDFKPILTSTWENSPIAFVSVIKEDNKFSLIYYSRNESYFGYATSLDGINWTKGEKAIFQNVNTVNNWANRIAYPFFISLPNEYRIYYTGVNIYGSGIEKLGFCRKSKN